MPPTPNAVGGEGGGGGGGVAIDNSVLSPQISNQKGAGREKNRPENKYSLQKSENTPGINIEMVE